MPAATRPALGLCVLGLALSAAPAWAGLECPEPTVRAGEVRSGTPLACDFRLINRGAQPIEITDVRATCGCLKPQLDRRQVPPGGAAVVHVEVNTLTQAAGSHTWMIRVAYTEAGRPGEVDLVLGAKVLSEIAVQPPLLTLFLQAGAATAGDSAAAAAIGHTITVTDSRPRPLAITSVQPSSPYLRVRVGEPRRDPAGHWARALQVEVAADCPPGRHDAVLRILAEDATYPELNVPVTIVQHSATEVRAAPEAVSLSGPAGQPLPSRIVLLSAPGDQEVAVEHIECDHPAVQCRWAPGPGRRATLKVQVDAARVPGDMLRTEVRVHLTRPSLQAITIPITCTLHGPASGVTP
jgi:hypothetical protein